MTLLKNTKEQITEIYSYIVESQKRYAKGEKLGEDYILFGSIYMKFWKRQNLSVFDGKQRGY